jgi:tRNA(Ile)-lysidine synthase
MFLPGQTVLVAVSGGPDSVCLLYALHHLRRLFRVRLHVFHFDHRLRRDSAEDARYVERLAARLGVSFDLIVAEDRPLRGVSKEAWAHTRRRIAAVYLARDLDAARIATAHTRDDQAESVLMGALLGRGLNGVSGIDPRTGPFVRPLIDVSRDEVEAFCRALRLRPRRDPTNRDPDYALRNAIRLRAIPALERTTGRSVREPLARTASLLREDAEELGRQMWDAWDDVVEETRDGAQLDAVRLLGLPRPIAGRLVWQALVRFGGVPTIEHVDAVLDLAEGRPGRRVDLGEGRRAVREPRSVALLRPT